MSVAFDGNVDQKLMKRLRAAFGDERNRSARCFLCCCLGCFCCQGPMFFYMLHHNLPQAAEDYGHHNGGSSTRAALTALYCSPSGPTGEQVPCDPAPVTSRALYVQGRSEPLWRRMPQPKQLASWISEEEMQRFVSEFERSGWEGGLNWYRKFDLDAAAMVQRLGRASGVHTRLPIAFVAGELDLVLKFYGGQAKTEAKLRAVCSDPCAPEITIIPRKGHWIQQEAPAEVNRALLGFLAKHLPVPQR